MRARAWPKETFQIYPGIPFATSLIAPKCLFIGARHDTLASSRHLLQAATAFASRAGRLCSLTVEVFFHGAVDDNNPPWPAIGGPARGRIHPHDHGPGLRHGAGRSGGRGHQSGAAGGRPHPPPAGRGRGFFPAVQPQQAQHRHRPAPARRAGGGAKAGAVCRCGAAKLQTWHLGQVRAGLRGTECAQSAPHLCEPHGLFAWALRKPPGPGRSGANDGRPGLHDRAPG